MIQYDERHKENALLKAFHQLSGVHGEIRTPDRPLRRRMLYPAELHGHKSILTFLKSLFNKASVFEKVG